MTIPGNIALFEGIDASDILSLLSCLKVTPRRFPRGTTLFREGDPVDSIGVVLAGSIQVYKTAFDGDRHIIAAFGVGEMFAESFVCARVPASPVGVTALEDATVLYLPFVKLTTLCDKACGFHKRLNVNLLTMLARKNLMLNVKIDLLTKRTIRERLLAFLDAERLRQKSDSFRIPYNRHDLAAYLCVDRAALSRELGKLRNEGVLDFCNAEFTFLKSNSLPVASKKGCKKPEN
jgi:CRP-like cAMP-binding protein